MPASPSGGAESDPIVDVGVVTWNTASLTADALRHLLDSGQGCRLRVLVHDNASSDGTPDAIAAAVPEAEVEVSGANLGFARGMNRLMRRGDAPWFLALNSDAWPEPGAIRALVEAAESHPDAAAVAPLLLRPDGTVEHSTHPFPTLGIAALDALNGRAWLPRHLLERRCLEGFWAHDRARSVDWAVGAALLMRRRALEQIGGFDERYFMYVEDLEWCWRANRRGWSIRFEPAAVVRHIGNVSGASRFGDRRAALEALNLREFLRDSRGPTTAATYRGLACAGLAWRTGWARLRGRPQEERRWRSALKAALGLVRPPVLDAAAGCDEPPPAGGPDVAVVVATRNRSDRLPALVAALERQTVDPARYEVLIVDDASTDDTPAVLQELTAATPLTLRTIRPPAHGGPAAGRNQGWRATRAAVVAFTDDDCLPAPGWLQAGLSALDGAPRVVVGRTMPPPDQLARCREPFALYLDVDNVRYFETCNVFYRRVDLLRSGGFDPRYRRPGGEDTDLGLRVTDLGVEAVFADDAVVFHDVRVPSAVEALRHAWRWEDIPLVVKDRPWARRELLHSWLFWRPSHLVTAAALVGLATGPFWRPGLALTAPWLRHRLAVAPVAAGYGTRLRTLPLAFAVDAVEVATMIRGSLRHRTLLL